MSHQHVGRRAFLRKSAFIVGAAAAPIGFAAGAGLPLSQRQDWQTFKTSPQYTSLLSAVAAMKANTDPNDPRSWTYWTNIHVNYCPHGIAYFLGWHRGYLYHFERQLRVVSGDAYLNLPYWDYYTDPNLPVEFTDTRAGNPLYVERLNTNVSAALSMEPFSPLLVNFMRGAKRAYEPSFENAPHNTLHNLIGGVMPTMQSPIDPIFWLHHANVDRLWAAWVAAGGGRAEPAISNVYWSGSYSYTPTLTMARTQTWDTRASLGYYYQNETLPAALPAQAQSVLQSQAFKSPSAPAVGSFALTRSRVTSDTTFAAVGARDVGLDERSVSVQLPPSPESVQALAQIFRGKEAMLATGGKRYKSVQVVFDNVTLTGNAGQGGFFYNIYLNLPAARNTPSGSMSALIGTLGPFQVTGGSHHQGGPAQLRYVVNRWVEDMTDVQISMLTVSFVRVNGNNRPSGSVIDIGEVRVELSSEEVES
jgi:tyrosinase